MSPIDSMTAMDNDKASQCNLESELGKSFVMFDVEDLYEVMWPRNKSNGRVYEIGDVASRFVAPKSKTKIGVMV